MIDTHAHLYLEDYDADRTETVARAIESGVTHIFSAAVDSASHKRLIDLANENPAVFLPTMGVHPTTMNETEDWRAEVAIVEKYLSDPPVERFYAVGEVGIDLHWSKDFLAEQIAAFDRQTELALEYGLPLAIHCRDSWPETLTALEKWAKRAPDGALSGVFHAFSGGPEEYRRIRELGDFVVGMGGPVTYKKSLWRALLPVLDPAHIVLETDAPWLSPEPLRGSRNEPANLTYIRDAAAAILAIQPAELDRITTENARRIFRF